MSRARWVQVVVALLVLFGAGFVLLGDHPVLSGRTARQWLDGHGRWAAAVSVALLAGDIVLPVPSSVVMTANGRLFGLVGGSVVSFVGSMSAWIGCYWLGRLLGWGAAGKEGRGDAEAAECRDAGGEKPAYPSHAPTFSRNAEGVRAATAQDDPVAGSLRRVGVLLLIATRPLPIVAELTAATAGVARMGWWRFVLGAALGTAPICLLFAWVGSRSEDWADSFVALAIAVAVPLLLYAAVARPWLARRG